MVDILYIYYYYILINPTLVRFLYPIQLRDKCEISKHWKMTPVNVPVILYIYFQVKSSLLVKNDCKCPLPPSELQNKILKVNTVGLLFKYHMCLCVSVKLGLSFRVWVDRCYQPHLCPAALLILLSGSMVETIYKVSETC